MRTFIARQPILNRQKRVFAYEFVYRPHVEDGRPMDPSQESFHVIFDICTLLNMEHLTKGKKVFIKTEPDLLADVHLQRLPTDKAVIEVKLTDLLEENNLALSHELKRSGYKLAVNVQTSDPLSPELIALADFIKADMLSIPPETCNALPGLCASQNVKLIAEGVENDDALGQVRESGFEYFQGPFLNRPERLSLKTIPSVKMHYLQLIQEVNKTNFDFSRIERIIRQDLSLSYNLLRHINSALYGTSREIHSLRQALALLGETAIRKWVSLAAFAEMGKDKPAEVVALAATRAKFCESVAPVVGLYERKEELFLIGMFSLLDVILDRNMAEALKEIPLAEDVKGALLGIESKLYDAYQYILAYEDGNWHRVWTYAAKLATQEDFLPHFYLEAVSWVEHHLYSPLAPSATV